MTNASQNAETQDKSSRHQAVIYDDDFATVSEIAAFLQVPTSWVYSRSRRRGVERIPHFKLGKYLRFSRREILEWIQPQRGISLASR